MSDVYAPPSSRDATPIAIRLYRVYAAGMALVNLLSAYLFWVVAPEGTGLRYVLLGAMLVLGVGFACAAAVPRTPWGWTAALVAIGLGLPSVAIVVAVPLLVAWRSPLVKAAFRRL